MYHVEPVTCNNLSNITRLLLDLLGSQNYNKGWKIKELKEIFVFSLINVFKTKKTDSVITVSKQFYATLQMRGHNNFKVSGKQPLSTFISYKEQQKNGTASWKLFQIQVQMHRLPASTTKPLFNSKRWWPSKFTTYLPWGHPNMWTIQQLLILIYKTTQVH